MQEFDRPRDAWAEDFARHHEHEDMERVWREHQGARSYLDEFYIDRCGPSLAAHVT